MVFGRSVGAHCTERSLSITSQTPRACWAHAAARNSVAAASSPSPPGASSRARSAAAVAQCTSSASWCSCVRTLAKLVASVSRRAVASAASTRSRRSKTSSRLTTSASLTRSTCTAPFSAVLPKWPRSRRARPSTLSRPSLQRRSSFSGWAKKRFVATSAAARDPPPPPRFVAPAARGPAAALPRDGPAVWGRTAPLWPTVGRAGAGNAARPDPSILAVSGRPALCGTWPGESDDMNNSMVPALHAEYNGGEFGATARSDKVGERDRKAPSSSTWSAPLS
mmetsp:Transcript_16996/g.48510  ORF Transcript_16996/g.48510 Transcript_16996/m.48510 type:complete len:280 (-) Transcript_16996:313-1152(-)